MNEIDQTLLKDIVEQVALKSGIKNREYLIPIGGIK